MNIWDTTMKLPGAELVETLLTRNGSSDAHLRIERIVSRGETTDWQTQADTEYVILLQGAATIEFLEGEDVQLTPGESMLIEAQTTHRVAYTSEVPECIWLCVHYAI